MSDQSIDFMKVLEMLATNDASVLAVGNIEYTIKHGDEPGDATNNISPVHLVKVENEIDGQEIIGESKSSKLENAFAGAINNYIKNILQDIVGYGVVPDEEERFNQQLVDGDSEADSDRSNVAIGGTT